MFSVSIPCLNMQAEKGLHGTVSGFLMFLGLSYAALYQEELRNGYCPFTEYIFSIQLYVFSPST